MNEPTPEHKAKMAAAWNSHSWRTVLGWPTGMDHMQMRAVCDACGVSFVMVANKDSTIYSFRPGDADWITECAAKCVANHQPMSGRLP